ncbi:unnamed protein product, partial [Ectocarpus sp. 12 AP-2014]
PPPYYRDCWHEVSRDLFLIYCHHPQLEKRFTTSAFSPSLSFAGSSFRSLSKIPHCWLP